MQEVEVKAGGVKIVDNIALLELGNSENELFGKTLSYPSNWTLRKRGEKIVC